jgi:hypothetical protein
VSDTPDYRPNVKIALSEIPTVWDADGKPRSYLLDRSDADLVLDSLQEAGWSIIPTEIANAAREVVESHTEVTELTGVLESFGPRFVEVEAGVWVNLDSVAAVIQLVDENGADDGCKVVVPGRGIELRASATDVMPRLTAGVSS